MIEIAGNTYFTYNIDNKLQSQLTKKYKKMGKTKEITLPDKKHLNQRIKLITYLIGSYAINNMIKTTRFYYIPYLKKRMQSLLNFKPPDMDGKSVGDVIKALQNKNIKVFIHGGLIRDIFLNVKSYDIDLIFDANIKQIIQICEEEKYPCSDIDIKNQNVNFGKEKGASIEGANLQNTLLNQKHLHEASVNDLVYDFNNNILIDLTGFGLHDCVYRLLRLSPQPKYWKIWAETDFKRPLRYFKLIQKGFKPFNKSIHHFVVNYITDNYDTLYAKVINPDKYPVSRIKHFIIKTITQGDINPVTGEYSYGPTQNKLIPYLKVLKKELPKHIFKKIMSNFTNEDLKKLKSAKIISTLENYIITSTYNNKDINNINTLLKVDKKENLNINKKNKSKTKKKLKHKLKKTKKQK
jgi:predicted nucleotidyltransferase